MIKEEFVCARKACQKRALKVTHNQKYCTNECCRIETNRKIMEKYHEKAAIKKGKKRRCSKCNTILSRYNEDRSCGACQKTYLEDNKSATQALITSVTWI